MSLIDQYFNKVPEYYDTMYMDGYTPEQIMYAARKKMQRMYEEREAAKRAKAEENEIPSVKIVSEVKIK